MWPASVCVCVLMWLEENRNALSGTKLRRLPFAVDEIEEKLNSNGAKFVPFVSLVSSWQSTNRFPFYRVRYTVLPPPVKRTGGRIVSLITKIKKTGPFVNLTRRLYRIGCNNLCKLQQRTRIPFTLRAHTHTLPCKIKICNTLGKIHSFCPACQRKVWICGSITISFRTPFASFLCKNGATAGLHFARCNYRARSR